MSQLLWKTTYFLMWVGGWMGWWRPAGNGKEGGGLVHDRQLFVNGARYLWHGAKCYLQKSNLKLILKKKNGTSFGQNIIFLPVQTVDKNGLTVKTVIDCHIVYRTDPLLFQSKTCSFSWVVNADSCLCNCSTVIHWMIFIQWHLYVLTFESC